MRVASRARPETSSVLIVALAAMLDISGRIVRRGSHALTEGRSHEQGMANLNALRRMIPLIGLGFIAGLGVIVLVSLVTGNQFIGAILAVALYSLPILAVLRARRPL